MISTMAEALAFAMRLEIAQRLETGAVCITRDGRMAVLEREITFRRADGNDDRSYAGWVGYIYWPDGARSFCSWTADGAASAYYTEDPEDLMERIV